MAKQSDDWKKKRAEKLKAEYAPAPWHTDEVPESLVAWEEIEPLLVGYVVSATTDAKASVQFTRSRDGGSLGVRVYDDTLVTKTEWGRPGEGLEDLLYSIGDYYRERTDREVLRWT